MSQDYLYQRIDHYEEMAGVRVPVDDDGHYLDPDDIRDGRDGKPEARDLTSPYGSLQFAVGFDSEGDEGDTGEESEGDEDGGILSSDGGDWMTCFDYAELPDGRIILHAVVNSDSGGFIEGAGYEIVSKEEAPAVAMGMVDDALEGVFINEGVHDEEGWNQDPYYFVRAVMAHCGIQPYASMKDNDLRRGPIPNLERING